jgi:hypothetical protein
MFDHTITIFDELIALEPRYLDRDIKHHIQNKLKSKKVGSCSKDYGFIQDIEIKKVASAEISMADGLPRFKTTYCIKSILPTPGKLYTSKKIVVINHKNVTGAIATIDESCAEHPFQIFIINGRNKCNQLQFDNCECVLPFDNGKQTPFSLPNIVVDTVQYCDKQFRVTGKHIHLKDDKEGCQNI